MINPKGRKLYLVVSPKVELHPEDGVILQAVTREQIMTIAARFSHDEFCIIDGKVIKDFHESLHIGRLEE